MNFILKLIGMIPVKKLVKYLPQILAFILTRVMKWASLNKPEMLHKIIFFAQKVTTVMQLTIEAGADGKFEPKELKEIADEWKKEI